MANRRNIGEHLFALTCPTFAKLCTKTHSNDGQV